MNLSRKRIKHLLLHKNKNQSKKNYKKNKNKKKIKNTFRKKIKKNLRTSSLKQLKKRKVSKYKRKAYLKGGGSQTYLNSFLQIIRENKDGGEASLENNKYYNFDFIFKKHNNIQEILSVEDLQKEFNFKAKTQEEKREDKEAEELKKIEEKEEAERKAREQFIDEESEKFIEDSKASDNSVIYIYNGEAGPAVAVQHADNTMDNWFRSISNALSNI